MMRTAIMVAAIVITIATSAFAQEWAEFVSREDRFTANFPGTPQVTQTTYKSQFGADLPAHVYSAAQGPSKFSITVADYAPLEKLLTEKSKSCPAGAETCKGNASPTSSTGAGYWKVDLAGAMIDATWRYMQRDAKVTEFGWNNIDLVEGHLLHLTNRDNSRTYVGIFMHQNKLFISEATVPPGAPEPGLFQQSLAFIDENGKTIRYSTFYHNGFPVPTRSR